MANEIACLDHGYVALVDTMGDDRTPARCARTSFRNASAERSAEQDAKLTDYLVRNKHTTPIEFCQVRFYMKMPIFVARQLVRHRTACIAGDVPVSFDLPGAEVRGRRQHYTLTMREIFERWQPTSGEQGDPLFKRRRVQGMRLRSLDEVAGEIYHANVKDIWSNGERDVYEVVFEDGSALRATMDHLCHTTGGWLRLEDALESAVRFTAVGKRSAPERTLDAYTAKELAAETWRPVLGLPKYEVSDLGRVRSLVNTRNMPLPEPRLKTPTATPAGYHVVSLFEDGRSKTHFVHHLVLEAFGHERGDGKETRHLDGCRINNRLTNLTWGTQQENADDRMASGGDQRLAGYPVKVSTVRYIGREETFDLEVDGPFHNFVAGGVVVHNSINEVSYRYVTAAREFYVPALDRMQRKSESNKQGSSSEIVEHPERCAAVISRAGDLAFDAYEQLLSMGLAPELARVVLPCGTYTEWYWQNDLHNTLHMLKLRLDPHAQYEIRVYAEAMLALLRPVFPTIIQSWERTL